VQIDGDELTNDLVIVHDQNFAKKLTHAVKLAVAGRSRGVFPGCVGGRLSGAERGRDTGSLGSRSSPLSSGDRAPASGAGCAGSNPAGGTHDLIRKSAKTCGDAGLSAFRGVSLAGGRSGV